MNAVETELNAQRRKFVEKDSETPFDLYRPVRAPAAQLVVEDDGATLRRQSLERCKVVMRRARPAVEAQERIEARREFADDPEPRMVAIPLDPAFLLCHRVILAAST